VERLRKLRDKAREAREQSHVHRTRHWSEAEIPDPKERPWLYRYLRIRWRTALAIATHPVMVALTVAIIVMSIPLYFLLGVSGKVREQQGTIKAQQGQMAALVKRIQVERKKTVGIFCTKINTNIEASHKLSVYLKKLLVEGAIQSRAFEDLYQQHGFPPYSVRVRKAREQARTILGFSSKPIDCEDIRLQIEQTTPPPPGPPPQGGAH
jgi:hypothetical protein